MSYKYIVAVLEDREDVITTEDIANALDFDLAEDIDISMRSYEDTKRCFVCRRPMEIVGGESPTERVCDECAIPQSQEFAKLMATRWYSNHLQDDQLFKDLEAFIANEDNMTGHRYAALRRYIEDLMGIDITQPMHVELEDFIAADET